MRRRNPEASSFDLFLDAICNTFGGIVFLAILLAILIQTRAIVKSPDQREESPISAEQLRELITQLDVASAEHAAVSASLDALPVEEPTTDDVEYRELLEKHRDLESRIAESIKEQAQQTKMLISQLAQNEQLGEENAAIPTQLRDLESNVDEQSAALQAIVSNRQTTIRLPRDRVSNAASVLGLLKGSRFYLAKLPSYASGAFNDDAVSTSPMFGGGITIKPRPGRGWSVGDPELRAMIQSSRNSGYVITLAVWPDSFQDFAKVKEPLVNLGVPYQLWPMQQEEELTLYPGGGQSRVQ